MIEYIRKRWLSGLMVLVMGIVIAILSIYQGRLLELIVDTAVGNRQIRFINLALLVVVYGITYFIFDMGYKCLLNKTTINLIVDVKERIVDGLSSVDDADEKHVAKYLAIIEKNTNEIFDKYFSNFFVIINQIILFIVAVAYLAYKNILLTILILATGMLSIVLPQIFVGKSQRATEVYLNHNKSFMAKITEYLEGMTVIKVFGAIPIVVRRIKDTNDSMEASHYKQLTYIALAQSMSTMLGFISLAINVVFAGYLCAEGMISIGSVLAIMQVMNYALNPMMSIPGFIFEMKSVKPIIQEIQSITTLDKSTDNKQTVIDNINSIQLNKVSLEKDGKRILQDISLNFEEGKKYLIVGKSGSGKSSLLKTILGTNSYNRGAININHSVELKDISQGSWFKRLAYAGQDGFVFNESILYNITLSEDTNNLLYNNCFIHDVGLEEFLESHQGNIDYVIAEHGANISGGERKRISLARAMFKAADVVIADEPNSGQDRKNSKIINDLLLKSTKMVIATMHNYTEDMLKEYDQIICMDAGEVVGQGTYNYLLNNCPEFVDLLHKVKNVKEDIDHEVCKVAE